jgi:hypothetical protein
MNEPFHYFIGDKMDKYTTTISSAKSGAYKAGRQVLAGALLACAFAQGVAAAEVGGAPFDDAVRVAGKELVLNGVGMRTKFTIKLYAAGLYLPERKTTLTEIQKLDGPRRVELIFFRDISSMDFGEAFMHGLSANTESAEKDRIMSQTMEFGEIFAALPGVKRGDVIHLDWIPGTGTICELNGRRIGRALPDIAFYNAVLRIWLGEHPVDNSLKPALMGRGK